jgi:hypothetical protein
MLLFGFISLTGTVPLLSKSKQSNDIQLIEQGLKWKEKKYYQKLAGKSIILLYSDIACTHKPV